MNAQAQNRVLVVDNNEDSLARLGKALTKAGFEATTTWSGIEALGLLDTGLFDAVLVDDYLPDLYVGEFLARITALATRPRIILMQSHPTCYKWTFGAETIPVVEKQRTSKILNAVIALSESRSEQAKGSRGLN